MKLYTVPLAPNPTKVMLYIAERAGLGTDMGIEQVVVNTLKGHHKQPEHLARNPFGTVPTLALDDGTYLRESLAIIEYLEDRFPDGGLLQGSAEDRARARDLERIVDLRLAGPVASFVHLTNSPLGVPPDPDGAAQMREKMQKPLDYLEELLDDSRPLLLGERVSIGDCTLQAALQFSRFAEADVIAGRPHLKAWDERYRARPAARQVLRW